MHPLLSSVVMAATATQEVSENSTLDDVKELLSLSELWLGMCVIVIGWDVVAPEKPLMYLLALMVVFYITQSYERQK